MTDFLVRFIAHLKRGIKDHWDYVIVVDGREGAGKSTLAAHLKAIYDGSYNLDRVSFDAANMLDRMQNVPPGSTVLVDEAIISMFKREAMQEFQIALAKAFSIVRARNLVFILVIPNYFDLDPHLRTRCNYRFYTYARRGVRGYFDVYKPNRNQWTRGDPFLELRWRGRFAALPEEFQDAYDEFKMGHMVETLVNIEAEVEQAVKVAQSRTEFGRAGTKLERVYAYLRKHPGATSLEVAKACKCTRGYARDIIRTISDTGKGQG